MNSVSINSLIAESHNSSQLSPSKFFQFSTIKILLKVICLIVLTFFLINYTIKFSTPLIVWKPLFVTIGNITSIQSNSTRTIFANRIRKYSKFRCTGDENNIDTWAERLCVFNNLCYNVQKQQFEYYRPIRNPKFPLFYDSRRGMLSDFGTSFVSLTTRGGHSWAPIVVDRACPSTDVTWLTNLHTLWREHFGDNNFGHVVWEDMGSISYSLDRMNEFDDQLMVMHVNAVSNHPSFQKYLDNVLTALTSKKVLEYKSYLASFKTNYICFRRFLAGGNLNVLAASGMKENDGKEVLFYQWRSKIIIHHRFDPEYVPNKHHILVTNKSTSVWAKAPSGMHRAIANLKEVVDFLKRTYPKIPVDVIEWHKVPFGKQIELLLNTTILITPAGGVSLIAPFLPHGSHAIVMDYYVTHNAFNFQTGSSASMDGMLLNHFPHIKKDYYQIYGKQDYVFDLPGTQDVRNDASIIINTKRLYLLMEAAFEDINL